MTDSYQAVYDATRSRISPCDARNAVESAVNNQFSNVGHQLSCLYQEFSIVAAEQSRPSAIYRPALSIDGNKWCALYGENLQDGVAGFGDSPDKAMRDFDVQWHSELAKPVKP